MRDLIDRMSRREERIYVQYNVPFVSSEVYTTVVYFSQMSPVPYLASDFTYTVKHGQITTFYRP